MKRLNDVWSNPQNTGIFTYLNMEWWKDFKTASANMDYHILNSGLKIISPLLESLLNDEYMLDNESKSIIATIVTNHYMCDWERLYNAIYADYNPINNYDMVEKETTKGENGITTTATNSTTTNTTGTLKDTTTVNNTTHDKIYGFNSTTGNNSDETTNTGSQSTESTNTQENNLTGNTTNTEKGTNNINRELTRSGNIGVTTSQQMIESEIELRKNNLLKIIFENIDTILTISCY